MTTRQMWLNRNSVVCVLNFCERFGPSHLYLRVKLFILYRGLSGIWGALAHHHDFAETFFKSIG